MEDLVEVIEVTRRTFKAQAVRITEENMHKVAEWCGGVISTTRLTAVSDIVYIRVPMSRSVNGSFSHAFVGQWLVKAHGRFETYRHAAFMGKFEQEALAEAERDGRMIGALVKLVERALRHNEQLISMHDHPAEELRILLEETKDEIKNIVGMTKTP